MTEGKACCTYAQWNIIQQQKGMDYWYAAQRGWKPKTLSEVKDVRGKMVSVVYFYLHEMSKKFKSPEV